jgi:hypothetical protein
VLLSIELICDVNGATRKESYCEECSLMFFEREKDLPTNKKEIAEFYGLRLEGVTV